MSDQSCVPTDVCVRWGCKRAPLVWNGRFYVCQNCGSSYGKNPHPDLPEPDPTETEQPMSETRTEVEP